MCLICPTGDKQYPLGNIRHDSAKALDIDIKLPEPCKNWRFSRKTCEKQTYGFEEMTFYWQHVTRFSVKTDEGLIRGRSLKINQFTNEKRQNEGSKIQYKTAVSVFQNVWVLAPEVLKMIFNRSQTELFLDTKSVNIRKLETWI